MLIFCKGSTKRGDTIVEVLIAVTVFSLLAVTSLSVMNKGVNTAQRALEISLVRQEMNSQAEMLRFVHDSYISGADSAPGKVWADVIKDVNVTAASSLASLSSLATDCRPPSSKAFIINPKQLNVVNGTDYFKTAQIFPKIAFNSSGAVTRVEGFWVQQLKTPAFSGAPGYRDFHIRACWSAPGSSVPITLGTIVRLYEPSV